MIQPSFSIIAGFLGSGKTSLVRHALETGLAGRRVAVLVNEAGALGVDGTVIRGFQSVERVIELDNGCICCVVDEYRLAVALREVAASTAADRLIIELSGAADPQLVIPRLRSSGFRCDAVTVVVDAANFAGLAARHRLLERQVAAGDFLVLNKTDLCPPGELARLTERLRRLNGRALVLQAIHGRVDARLVFGVPSAARAAPGAAPHGIESFACSSEQPVDLARFERFLSELPAQVYRAKGFLREAYGARALLFNYVAGRYDLRALPAALERGPLTQAVFLGWQLAAVRDALSARFGQCVQRPAAVPA